MRSDANFGVDFLSDGRKFDLKVTIRSIYVLLPVLETLEKRASLSPPPSVQLGEGPEATDIIELFDTQSGLRTATGTVTFDLDATFKSNFALELHWRGAYTRRVP